MGLQLSTTARNGRLNAIPTAVGTSAKLRIYTGSAPGLAKSTNTAPIYLLLALVGIVAFMGAAQ